MIEDLRELTRDQIPCSVTASPAAGINIGVKLAGHRIPIHTIVRKIRIAQGERAESRQVARRFVETPEGVGPGVSRAARIKSPKISRAIGGNRKNADGLRCHRRCP